MKGSFFSVPWNTPELWREANACLATAIRCNKSSMADLFAVADRIRQQLGDLFPVMDDLCRTTCPHCKEICCSRAWIWADFKDLLFYHLADVRVPDRQLLGENQAKCLYGGPGGCRLARIQRPFVCTWYVCPDQSEHLRKTPTKMRCLCTSLREIKSLRKEMEAAFIKAVA